MFRFTVLYKNTCLSYFDFDYYINKHLPLSKKLLSEFGLSSIEVQKNVRMFDRQDVEYLCISHVSFPSFENLTRSVALVGEELRSDIPNYTNIEPQAQISEIILNL